MKSWLIVFLSFAAFAAGIIVGLRKEARRIERMRKERQRIQRDYPDSVEKDYKIGAA